MTCHGDGVNPLVQFPAGVERIQAGTCPIGARSPIACFFCPFGHMTECHHPQTCEQAQCSHFSRIQDEVA